MEGFDVRVRLGRSALGKGGMQAPPLVVLLVLPSPTPCRTTCSSSCPLVLPSSPLPGWDPVPVTPHSPPVHSQGGIQCL